MLQLADFAIFEVHSKHVLVEIRFRIEREIPEEIISFFRKEGIGYNGQ